jgi:hypothetical protein
MRIASPRVILFAVLVLDVEDFCDGAVLDDVRDLKGRKVEEVRSVDVTDGCEEVEFLLFWENILSVYHQYLGVSRVSGMGACKVGDRRIGNNLWA